MISDEQVERFAVDGYLILPQLVDPSLLAPLVSALDEEVRRRARALAAEGRLTQTHEELGFERQLAAVSRETNALVESLWMGQPTFGATFRLITSSTLLDLASRLLGTDEIIASSGHWVRPKVPGSRTFEFPWHQDTGYMPPACDRELIITVWIALVDATPERGCLWVHPQAHRGGTVLPHRLVPQHHTISIAPDAMPQTEPVCAAIPKGGAVVFHNLTPHASFTNTSDVVRWTFDVRYAAASIPTNAAITRLPGEAQGPEAPPHGCLPPEADFLVRSARRPGEVLRTEADYVRMRREHVAQPLELRWKGAE